MEIAKEVLIVLVIIAGIVVMGCGVAALVCLVWNSIVLFFLRSPSARTTLNYEPRGDRVIVKRLPKPAPVPGAMFLPDSQQRPLNEGMVLAVGPEIDDIEPGEHICFLDFAGTAVEIDGVEYLSMRDEEIHGKR